MEFLWYVLTIYALCVLGYAYKEGKWEAVRMVSWTGVQCFIMGLGVGAGYLFLQKVFV